MVKLIAILSKQLFAIVLFLFITSFIYILYTLYIAPCNFLKTASNNLGFPHGSLTGLFTTDDIISSHHTSNKRSLRCNNVTHRWHVLASGISQQYKTRSETHFHSSSSLVFTRNPQCTFLQRSYDYYYGFVKYSNQPLSPIWICDIPYTALQRHSHQNSKSVH